MLTSDSGSPCDRCDATPTFTADRRGDARALHRRDDRRVQHRRVGAAERARLPADRSTRRRVVGQSAGEQRPLSGLRRRLLRLAGAQLTRSAQLAGFFPSWNALYSGPDGVERIDVGAVSANFLRTLGASPTIGRDFADGEDRRGAAGTVILSHEFWSRALQADPRDRRTRRSRSTGSRTS